MSFDLGNILQSKREFRKRLAAKPIEEKLATLDALRERALVIRPVKSMRQRGELQEHPRLDGAQGKKLELSGCLNPIARTPGSRRGERVFAGGEKGAGEIVPGECHSWDTD